MNAAMIEIGNRTYRMEAGHVDIKIPDCLQFRALNARTSATASAMPVCRRQEVVHDEGQHLGQVRHRCCRCSSRQLVW